MCAASNRETPPALRLVKKSDVGTKPKAPAERTLFSSSHSPPSLLVKRTTSDKTPLTSSGPKGPPPESASGHRVLRDTTASSAQPHSEESFVLVWKPLPSDLDLRIVDVITAPPPVHLSAQAAHQAKEHQLGELFASLPVPDALALHRRLIMPASDDPVPAAFERLTSERRDRLVRFLGDARRRAAQSKPCR